MRIGFTEICLIIVVAMALIRPDKLKEYAKAFGQAFRTFKEEKEKVDSEIISPIKDSVDTVRTPVDEVVQDVKSMVGELH